MTKEMEDIVNSSERHIVVEARAGCVDKDTEYFNGEKWVKISEYKNGDKVLQFNDKWDAELVEPISYIKNPRDKMYKLLTKYGVDMMLSDNHRVIYIDNSHGFKFGANNLLEIKCEDLVNRHFNSKKGFSGKFLTTFNMKNEIDLDISCDELRLNMAIISDGSICNENTKYIRINLKKERKKERLIRILERMNIQYEKKDKDNGYSIFTFKFEKAVKKFDFNWLYLPKNKKMALFNEIPYWDGSIKTNPSGYSKYHSTDKHNADFIQMLASSLNIRATILKDDRVGLPLKEKYIRKSICYTVIFTDRKTVGIGNQSKIENRDKCISYIETEDGFEYCFRVPSGMLILRRNDNIFITGNCGKSTTIKEYIKQHPYERVLYLVFSAEMKREAEKNYKGLNNCEIRTIHSLAYRWWINSNKYTRYLGMSNNEIMKQLRDTSQLEIRNILNDYDLGFDELQKIYFYYNMFLCSDKKDTLELTPLNPEDKIYLLYAKKVYEYHRDNYVPVPHNFYLKQFSLTNPKLNGYDTICLDECLDGNMYVKTDKGHIKIKNIHKKILKGEKIKALSFNHRKNIFEMEDIIASKATLNRDIFEIKTYDFNILKCTDNHRVLTQFGYVYVKHLVIGVHKLVIEKNKNCYYKDIKYIQKIGVSCVYDISVNNNHNFITSHTIEYDEGIVVHNCQDINNASLNVITASNLDKKIIAVGDTAQSIFNFMHCKNALKILKNKYGFKEYKLTMSFRISEKVASMCSRLLKWFYNEDMTFHGNNKTELVNIDLETIDEQVTILSRTRLGALLEVLCILDIRESAKFYYYGGLEKYDLDKIENMMKYDGFIFIDGQKFHVNTLRQMVKEGLNDPVITGIISRYDFIKKHKNCLYLLKSSETKNIKEADFCLNTLHGSKGSTYEIVKFADDIGGVSDLKDKYIESIETGIEYNINEIENSLNLLYVGLSRATKYLDIGKAFVKKDKLATGNELANIV